MSRIPQPAAFASAMPVVGPGVTEPTFKRWTREEYSRRGEQGRFEGQRVELIDGEIVLLSRPSPQQGSSSEKVRRALERSFGDEYWVRRQGPLVYGDYSEPEPDIGVVRGAIEDFSLNHLTSSHLIAEVSLTSLKYDESIKHSLYADMGVPEFSILDVANRQLIVQREPQQDSAMRFGYGYASVVQLGEAESVSPLEKPQANIAVANLLPRMK